MSISSTSSIQPINQIFLPPKKVKSHRKSAHRKWEESRERVGRGAALSDALGGLIEELGMAERLKEQCALDLWESAVGEGIAAAARAQSIREGVLTVKARDHVWRNELLYQQDTIRENINRAAGWEVVKKVRVV